MKIEDLILKIKRKWMKIRLQPIRVFCFHQVSDTFDESTMERIDWLQTDAFKRIIYDMQQSGYEFITLQEAHKKIKNDIFRCKKYAVLTADDGWASLNNILPWLNEQQIPVTLFLNPAYLDGKHFRDRNTEKYLTEDEVRNLNTRYPLLTIGSHGWEHIATTSQTQSQFIESVNKSVRYLSKLPNFVPYFAYTWGWNWINTNEILWKSNLTPVKLSGVNYNDFWIIKREPLDKIE